MFKLLLISLEIALVLICPYSCMLTDAIAASVDPREQHVGPCCEKCAETDHQLPQDDQEGDGGECFCKGAIVVDKHAADVQPESPPGIVHPVNDSISAFQFSSSRECVGFDRGWSNAGKPLRLFLGSLQI